MLTQQLVYRPLGHDESLTNYIEEIKFTAEILLTKKTKQKKQVQISDVILGGLSLLKVRTSLVFTIKPRALLGTGEHVFIG